MVVVGCVLKSLTITLCDCLSSNILQDKYIYLACTLHKNGCDIAAVISAMGANISSRFLYAKVRGQMQEGMKEVGFQSLSIMRP
jgi:hypothetical protein